MAIIPRNGGVKSQDLPFELGEAVADNGATKYGRLLGTIFELADGLQAILVKAGANQLVPAKLAFKWSDTVAREVVITSALGNRAVGFAHPDQEDIVAGDFFFLMRAIAGHGRLSGISAAAIVAGVQLQPTTDGKLITDAAYELHVSVGTALTATAAIDLDVEVKVDDLMPGAFA